MLQLNTNILILTDDYASVAIAPEIGGAIVWYRSTQVTGQITADHVGSMDWFRATDETDLQKSDAGEMACFPLVPYSNRIRNGKFTFGDQKVQLPSTESDPHFEHGHGWRHKWSVETQDATSAVLVYKHQPDSWPWGYEARQFIRLVSGVLAITLSIKNCSDEPMPAGFGLHPFFPASNDAYIDADVTAMWEVDSEVLPTKLQPLPKGKQTIAVDGSNLDNVFCGWFYHARIVWPERGAALDITAEAPLDFLVLYTPQGEPYFCAEPVSNATDAFNLAPQGVPDTGMFTLNAGEVRKATIRFVPHTHEHYLTAV